MVLLNTFSFVISYFLFLIFLHFANINLCKSVFGGTGSELPQKKIVPSLLAEYDYYKISG